MFSTIPIHHMSISDAIPFEFSSTSIGLFLDRYCSPNAINYDSLPFSTLHEYLKFLRRLDCDRLLPLAEHAYRAVCEAHPYELLLAASLDDDLECVPFALTRCGAVSQKLDATNIFRLVSEVRDSWRLPLIKCLLQSMKPTHNGYRFEAVDNSCFKISWPTREQADRFVEDVLAVRKADGI